MLIAIDIGNTNLKVITFVDGMPAERFITPLSNIDNRFIPLLDRQPDNGLIEGFIVCSVVAWADARIIELIRQHSDAPVIHIDHQNGLPLKIRYPERIGVDRIAAATGAYAIFQSAVCVVSVGSAITINCVDNTGNFIGGAIMPGLRLMSKALNDNTAALPLVDVSRGVESPLGADTDAAILSGIIIGAAGAIERIIAEVGTISGLSFMVILTGGDAGIVIPYLKIPFTHDPDIVHKGMYCIYTASIKKRFT